jgi:hypothetical protein
MFSRLSRILSVGLRLGSLENESNDLVMGYKLPISMIVMSWSLLEEWMVVLNLGEWLRQGPRRLEAKAG